jgi:hypothetical protein
MRCPGWDIVTDAPDPADVAAGIEEDPEGRSLLDDLTEADARTMAASKDLRDGTTAAIKSLRSNEAADMTVSTWLLTIGQHAIAPLEAVLRSLDSESAHR